MEDFAAKLAREREERMRAARRDRSAGFGSPPPGLRRPTMTDVAQIAGVSQSSVSLALNQMIGARISEATRARVIEAARSIGYELPAARRYSTVGPPRASIAYLVDEISTSPHPVVNLDGARDWAWEAGYLVCAHVTRSNGELEACTIAAIKRDASVIGVIYSTIFTREVSLPRSLEGVPTVLLNCYDAERRFACVVPDETAGAYAATAHLLEKGHRRIAFINGEPWMDASADRLKGYQQALADAGVAFEAALLRHGDWLPAQASRHARALIAQTPRPSAIFCANDLMAMGALEAAALDGLRVPEDISIMGYDDQELARYTNPPLSTLVLPNYEMGRRAAELLIDIATHGAGAPAPTIRVDGPLVERASVGAPALR
ncbi:MAG: LacI family DNA-binding transcriptional regulator [Roseiarcus sp.]|jgi:LacI family transcriptional regulator, galactose operon repressor